LSPPARRPDSSRAFGHDDGLLVIGALAVNLMIGLGDDPDAVEKSMLATLAARRRTLSSSANVLRTVA